MIAQASDRPCGRLTSSSLNPYLGLKIKNFLNRISLGLLVSSVGVVIIDNKFRLFQLFHSIHTINVEYLISLIIFIRVFGVVAAHLQCSEWASAKWFRWFHSALSSKNNSIYRLTNCQTNPNERDREKHLGPYSDSFHCLHIAYCVCEYAVCVYMLLRAACVVQTCMAERHIVFNSISFNLNRPYSPNKFDWRLIHKSL